MTKSGARNPKLHSLHCPNPSTLIKYISARSKFTNIILISAFFFCRKMNVLKNLSKVYVGPNSLWELAEMHRILMETDPKCTKKMRDAIAREKIARSGLGIRQKGKWAKMKRQQQIGGENENYWGMEKVGEKEKDGEEASEPFEGNGEIGQNKEGTNPPPAIDLDPEFLKTLEKLAETSSQFGCPSGESSSQNSAPVGNPATLKCEFFEGNNENAGQINKMAQSPMERDGMESPDETQDVAEWRQRFEKVLSLRYAKSERIRFLFCRKMYGHYVERMRQINRLKNELRTCKEKRLIKKFNLDKDEQILLDRNTGKPYLCYEDIFDAIRNCHMNSDVNEMRMLFSQLKEQYANITFECVLEYFKVRSKQQQQQQWPEMNSGGQNGSMAPPSTSPFPPAAFNPSALIQPQMPSSQSKRLLFLENSSASEDEFQQQQNAPPQNMLGPPSPGGGGGKMLDQLKFSRSKYRNLFHTDEQNSVYCKLCPFMLTASSSNQTYQKIRNHIRYNHTPWNMTN